MNNFKRLLRAFLAGFITAAALYGFVTVYQAIRSDDVVSQQRAEQELNKKQAAVMWECRGRHPHSILRRAECCARLMKVMI